MKKNELMNLIDKDTLENLYIKQGLSQNKIANIYNCSQTGIDVLVRKYNLRKDNKFWHSYIKINKQLKGLIIGSLLGDGGLSKPKKYESSSMFIKHGLKQYQYLQLKRILFSDLKPSEIKYTDNNQTARFYTIYHPIFLEYRNKTYTNKGKEIINEWINDLTEEGFAIWYFDDGYYKKPGQYNLATHCFGLEGNKYLRKFLLKKFNIETTIIRDKKYYRLYIVKKSYDIMDNILSKYSIPCLDYKIRNIKNTNKVWLKKLQGSPETTCETSLKNKEGDIVRSSMRIEGEYSFA